MIIKEIIYYQKISNCELFHNNENKIILNGTQNDFNNNSIFFIFNDNVRISLIKFYPLTKKEKNQNVKSLNSLQESSSSTFAVPSILGFEEYQSHIKVTDQRLFLNASIHF